MKNRISTTRVLAAVAAIAGAVGVTAFASSASGRDTVSWANTSIGRGVTTNVTAGIRAQASRSSIDPGTVRTLDATGPGRVRLTLLRGSRSDGATCLAAQSALFVGAFNCLGRTQDAYALLYFAVSAGTATTVDQATVIGVARGDVRSVGVVSPSGTQEVAVGRDHVFSYVAAESSAVPTAIVALDARGRTVQQFQLDSAPPTS